MKIKTLVLTFSYNQIIEEWVKGKDYRLPTLEEAKLLSCVDNPHNEIWIQSDDISDDHYGFLYNKKDDRVYHANRNFMYNAVLIKEVDVVVEWAVSSTSHNSIFKMDCKDEALEFIDDNKIASPDLRLVKITKEYYR